ncbi:MAG: DNA-deoxyinosine glycosylase [Methylococcales bacterium]
MNSFLVGFKPIISINAKILILGSMPSSTSIKLQQYYGHPRNTFWPIMSALLNKNSDNNYSSRKDWIISNNIAVWDVLQNCERTGSLDANINSSTAKANDFTRLFNDYPNIKQVFFNGKLAEKLYKRYVLPSLNNQYNYLTYYYLPSTSPAYAALKLEQKIEAWKAINQSMVK